MKQNRSLIVGVILTAAAGFVAIQGWIEPKPETGTLSPTSTFTLTPTASYEGCAYVWVYHDAADLTAKLNAQIAALDPKASANASLYGEDCVYSDGHSTFGAMETDFYIHLPAEGPINEEAFGNWMANRLRIHRQNLAAEFSWRLFPLDKRFISSYITFSNY